MLTEKHFKKIIEQFDEEDLRSKESLGFFNMVEVRTKAL